MRTIFAGLFAFTSMMAVVWMISVRHPGDRWPWWALPAILLTFFASVFLTMGFFYLGSRRPSSPRRSEEEEINELKQQGLLVSEQFSATRAFAVEEFEDEGSHYYIELRDGRTLYLNGQYLYDYEPIEDDPEFNRPRKLPCTEFTVFRHKKDGYVVNIECTGAVLEPEVEAPPFGKDVWKQGPPEDGDIFAEPTYDQVKVQRLGTSKT